MSGVPPGIRRERAIARARGARPKSRRKSANPRSLPPLRSLFWDFFHPGFVPDRSGCRPPRSDRATLQRTGCPEGLEKNRPTMTKEQDSKMAGRQKGVRTHLAHSALLHFCLCRVCPGTMKTVICTRLNDFGPFRLCRPHQCYR